MGMDTDGFRDGVTEEIAGLRETITSPSRRVAVPGMKKLDGSYVPGQVPPEWQAYDSLSLTLRFNPVHLSILSSHPSTDPTSTTCPISSTLRDLILTEENNQRSQNKSSNPIT